eukprot:scaffold56007_cov46-Prasinocladus_malaysianus.AAC.1
MPNAIHPPGSYSTWTPAKPYTNLFMMVNSAGVLHDGKCVAGTDYYSAAVCPPGSVKVTSCVNLYVSIYCSTALTQWNRAWKVSREAFDAGCSRAAAKNPKYTCPEGYTFSDFCIFGQRFRQLREAGEMPDSGMEHDWADHHPRQLASPGLSPSAQMGFTCDLA